MIVKSSNAAPEPDVKRVVGKDAKSSRPAVSLRSPAESVVQTGNSSGQKQLRIVPGGAARKQHDLRSDISENQDQTTEQNRLLEAQLDATESNRRMIANLTRLIDDEFQRTRIQTADFQLLAIELGVAVASQICQSKIDSNDYPLQEIVSSITRKLGLERLITVYLHPKDVASMESAFRNEQSSPQIVFLPDSSLQRGECRAANEERGLIATIDLQAAEIRQLLLEGIHDAQLERQSAGE